MKKLKVAFVGLSHSHARMLYNSFTEYPDKVEIIGFADVDKRDEQDFDAKIEEMFPIGRKVVKFYENWLELLNQKPDLVVCNSDNASHVTVAVESANRGIHVLVEKPMCTTYEDALTMYKAAKENNVMMATNWPIAWFPAFNKAIELAKAGTVGKITRVLYRSPATWGPYSWTSDEIDVEKFKKTWWYKKDFGGGAIYDYACYGAALSCWFYGKKPNSVTGITKNFMLNGIDVEDYSYFIADFGNGVGLMEGSWATFNSGEVPSGPVFYGDQGTIVCDRHSTKIKIYKSKAHGHASPTEVIDCAAYEAGSLTQHILQHLLENKPLHPLLDPELNVNVMAILGGGRESAETGKKVEFN